MFCCYLFTRQEKNTEERKDIEAVYFDGRKDQTIIQIEGRRIVKQEEHVSLIEEPESKYFGHLLINPPANAVNIATNVLSYTRENSVNPKNLKAIGCDGTNVNTGWKDGVIRIIEVQIEKPLQWVICMLHANELPLRHLLQQLDGQTKGPNSFSGLIGLLLVSCDTKPVQKFQPINILLPEVDDKDLSTDQRYLYQICCAIRDGCCSEALTKRDPRKLNHARWLTTANRILRLYVATCSPSQHLLLLVQFIMKVYASS